MTRILALLCILSLMAGMIQPAVADSEADPAYVFGTTLVLHSTRQLADPNKTWWGDLLPMEYRFSIGSIVDAVNKARALRGQTVMVDVTTYPINVGGEFSVDGGWEYTIDFQKMFPQDVEVVLEKFPLTGVFADLKRDVRPVRVGYFWANNQLGEEVKLELPGFDLVVSPDEGFGVVRERIAELLTAQFAGRAKFDLSMNRYSAASGYQSFDVSITVYLDGAESDMMYGTEGYEHDH
jgi:hypothetical protein